jgi:hypothetical protein
VSGPGFDSLRVHFFIFHHGPSVWWFWKRLVNLMELERALPGRVIGFRRSCTFKHSSWSLISIRTLQGLYLSLRFIFRFERIGFCIPFRRGSGRCVVLG